MVVGGAELTWLGVGILRLVWQRLNQVGQRTQKLGNKTSFSKEGGKHRQGHGESGRVPFQNSGDVSSRCSEVV